MIPKLRFPHFTVEWQVNSFDQLFIFSSGKNIKQDEASPGFETPCVRYGELYHLYSEVINNVVNYTNIPRDDLVFSKGDEILLPSAGEDPMDIGSASALTIENVAIGRTINVLRPKDVRVYDQIFAAYYINSVLKKRISRLAKGNSISNVYNSDLKKLTMNLPGYSEQEKIAEFLTAVDERIALMEKKLKLLKRCKKGVMQKIFTQQIRFKDENGQDYPDWQTKELGELAKIKTGNLNVQDANNAGKYTFFDRSEEIKKYDEYSFDNEALIYAGEGARFLPRYFNGRYGLHQRAYSIHDVKKVNMKYLYFYMLTMNNYFLRMAVGSTAKSLRMDCFTKCPILLPYKEEQQKIATFLAAIDGRIRVEQAHLTAARQWKKGLLQRMFV